MRARSITTIRNGWVVAASLLAACASAPAQPGPDADLNAIKRRASLQIGAGDYAEAVRSLQSYLKSQPKDDQAYAMLGDAYRGLGDFANAVKSYEQAMRIDYGDYQPHLKLGTLLMENGKTGRALTEFEVAMKFSDGDPLVYYNYGLALHDLGRTKEALPQWRAALELEPDNPDFVAAVGIGLTGVDDQAAVEAFHKAETLGQRRDGDFCNNYALALERVGENARADTLFNEAVAIGGPKQNEYRRNLARHYLRAGDNESAAREFETLVASDGGKWSDTVYLARARVALARFDEAIDGLSSLAAEVESGRVARTDPRIDRMPPTLGEALSIVGMAWRGNGDLARSRDYLRRAAVQAPDDPSVLNNYGVVLAESGMLPDAKAQWRRVLEIDPANATAKANLSAFGQ
ncbi:MAG TPA: tetratricopeptide repeat protein [Candidatus Krumholzibacteria bacterium]|nr:tetratricopeptide repeat protein [Candidatus Krumholzibacteria bacterium]